MSVVIKEIIVKTTVEREKRQEQEMVIPQEMLERLKEEILREIEWQEQSEPRRKEKR